MDFGQARKRGRPEAGLNGNAGFKKNKQEMESFPGLGSKSKPCTKFFSTTGCPFGEGCHFLHYVPGGINVVAQMTTNNPPPPPSRNNPTTMGPPPSDGPAATAKTKMCNKFNTPEGCKFGDKCHFAHGERELGMPLRDTGGMGGPGRFGGARPEAPAVVDRFGASATAKISVDASLAGAIIGKGGVNSKQICRITGVKLAIREHETDPNLRNIELEGTFDQIKQASSMVGDLIVKLSSSLAPSGGGHNMNMNMNKASGGGGAPANNFKTKLCENFAKGSCTFGERCHFAHGAAELRKQPAA